MLRNPVTITGMGRTDWTSTLQAVTLTLTLNNRDGRFTPKLSAGAYYPDIGRNVQIRVSVNATSATAVAYSGYRFWGEVAEWPPKWDAGGRDIYVDITANGIWRRMSQLQTTLGSAFTRYNSLTLTGTSAPRAYWPCEDGTGSGSLVAYDSVAGTANATQSFTAGQAGLSLAACTDFKGSDGIPQLNAAMITATVPAGGTATNNVTRFLMSVPAAGDSASGTTNWNLVEIASSGTIAKFEVYLNYAGTLLMQLRNSGGSVVASGTTTTNVKGVPYLVSCELTPSGGNVAFALRIIAPGAAGITESVTGTVTTASVGAVTTVKFGRANVLMDTAVGQLSVTYGAVPSMVNAAYAVNGYIGELALDRFTRICGEMSIAAETIGTAASSAAMGPQMDDTLTNVLQAIEDVDMGLLFESRTQFGLGYRTLTSMANQSAAATISYTAAILDPSLAPVYDDSLTRNNVTVTNYTGYTQQAILTVGSMSILNPPNGIGNGYGYSRSVSAASDTQIGPIANWLLNVGSVDEVRFPTVTVKLARTQAAALFAALPGLRPGDYIQLTNLPSHLTAATVKQLTFGYTEVMGGETDTWDFTWNTVPETPYETGFSPGTVQLAQLPGSGAVTSTAPGAGGLGGIIANGSITPSMLNEGITVKTLGGKRVTISAGAPANPDTDDIWIDSDTGLISSWDGAAWQPFKFDGAATIQAGTIVAANIAASTLTASLIAAGQVYAGFVDATTVAALKFIASGTMGEFMAYDGTPGSTTLAASIAGRAGTDAYSNAFATGVEVHKGGLVLDNQASAPSAVTDATSLYSSIAGRLRYLASTGENYILERGSVNVSQFSVGNTTTWTVVSGGISYKGTAASNQSSTFEIEITGAFHTSSTGTKHQPWFTMAVDGTPFGNPIEIGAASLNDNVWYTYAIRFRLAVLTSGAPGTATTTGDGIICQQSVVINSITQTNYAVGVTSSSVSFNTTTDHTLAVYGKFDATATSQQMVTYITRTTNYS